MRKKSEKTIEQGLKIFKRNQPVGRLWLIDNSRLDTSKINCRSARAKDANRQYLDLICEEA